MGLLKKITPAIALLVAFSTSMMDTAGMHGITVDHGEVPGLGGGHDKAKKFKSTGKTVGQDRIQITPKGGSGSSSTDSESLP